MHFFMPDTPEGANEHENTINAYKNSICSIDVFLDDVAKMIQKTEVPTVGIYCSETLMDDGSTLYYA